MDLNTWLVAATVAMALATIAIAIAASYQALFSKRLLHLQETIEAERKRVEFDANLRWLRERLGTVAIDILNLCPAGLGFKDLQLVARDPETGQESLLGFGGSLVVAPYESGEAGTVPLSLVVGTFDLQRRPRRIELFVRSSYSAHGKTAEAQIRVFDGELVMDGSGQIVPRTVGR